MNSASHAARSSHARRSDSRALLKSRRAKFLAALARSRLLCLAHAACRAAELRLPAPHSSNRNLSCIAASATAQVPHPNESKFFLHLAEDQKDIWTSPFHLKPNDAKWLVPMGGIATGLFVTDPQSSYAMRLDNQHALNLASDAGVGAAWE